MKRKVIFSVIIFVLGVMSIPGTKAEDNPLVTEENFLLWTEYKTSPPIVDIAVGDDYVWGAHLEGVLRWDKQDQTYTNFTQADGLIDSYATAVEIDNGGNIWVGTPSGLSRFDGNIWTHFTSSNGLVNNYVLSLSLGPNGELLVGTGAGLSIFDGVSWIPYSKTDPYGCLQYGITDAEIDNRGYIWISTTSYATCYLAEGTWKVLFHENESVNSDQIELSENGDLWLAGVHHQNKQGVMYYGVDGTWIHYTAADGLLDDDTTSLTIDGNGDVWVGINGYGLGVSRFDGVAWTSYSKQDGYYGGGVIAIQADKNNDIWTGGGSNASRFHNGSWQAYLAGPPYGFAYEMTMDQNDHLWMGIYRNGVVEYDGQKWVHYTKSNGLPGDHVVDILADQYGNMWFACYEEQWYLIGKGITRYDGASWETFTMSDGLASDRIEDLAMDENGVLWVAHRYSSGVDRKTDTGWVNYKAVDGLLFARVGTIFAQGNAIWVGYRGGYSSGSGASQFDGLDWISYEDELLSSDVNNFTTNLDGDLLALAQDGINEFNGTVWNGYAIPSVTDFNASDFAIDKNGSLWVVGYQDLFIFNGNSWAFYNEANTPVSRLINEIAINEAKDEVWIDSQDGVVKMQTFNLSAKVFLPAIQN